MAKKGGSKSAPAAPDPVATANAQTAMNEQTARTNATLNRVNQTTPYGTQTYTDLGAQWLDQAAKQAQADNAGDPSFDVNAWKESANRSNPFRNQWTATTTLSPEQQNLLNLSTAAQQTYGEAALSQLQRAKEGLSTPFTPNFATLDDPNVSRDQVEKALTERIAPLQERDRAALETRLANQGIGYGSTMWNRAQDDFNRGLNDARLGVITAGGQEQSRQASLNQALRQAALQEQLTLRAQPINEAAALLTGQQVQQPTFNAVPQVTVAPTDYTSLVNNNYTAQMNAHQQSLARQQAALGGTAGLLGTVAGAAFGSPWVKGLFG